MGLFDAVKHEAGRSFIARPPERGNDVVFMWPDRNVKLMTQLTVHEGEVCLFVKDGKVAGVLPPKADGPYSLDTHNVPFISRLLESVTGGNLFLAELWFVLTREITGIRFGGPIGEVRDPETKLAIGTMVHGEFSLRILDPQKLVVGMIGLQQVQNDQVLGWFKQQVLKALREEVGGLVVKKRWPLLDVTSGAYTVEIEQTVLQSVKDQVAAYGVEVVKLGNFEVSINDEDAETLKKFSKDVAYSNLAGGYNAYAAGQAMMGAGEGMSRGGEGGGAAMQGMGLGVGLAMAQNFGMPRPAAPAQGMGGAPAVAMVACPKCNAQVPAGRFCGSCGQPLAAGPQRCACGAEVAPGMRFCPGCGKPQ